MCCEEVAYCSEVIPDDGLLLQYAPALPEAAIGDMDPFSVKPVARPLTIQAPDGDAGQSLRSRQSTRGRGRRFMSPPGRA